MSAGPSDPKSNPYQASQQPDLQPAGLAPLGKLGSLSQSARLKSLNSAKGILIVIGVLTVIFNGIQIPLARDQIHEAINREVQKLQGQGMIVDQSKVKEAEDTAMRIALLILGGFIALGVLFIVLGLAIKSYPVPITVTSLVLYLAGAAFSFYLDPEFVGFAAIIKIFIVIALVKAIQSAIAYERERRTEAAMVDVAGYPQ